MYLGVDYYPEQWDESYIESDLNNILELGSNVIRIGEFAWHIMEKTEGNYDFSYFDKVIKLADEKGLKVIFGTPTATMPAWLAKKNSDILSEFESGEKRVFGGRRQYCFNSKSYYNYSEKIIRALANHFKDNETIVAWQIDNEFGHEDSDKCFCENCKNAFKEYLQDKYNNDIDKLNETFGTTFWSQQYNDFSEIPIPKKTITTHNPALRMEWESFRNLSVVKYSAFQVNILKEILAKDKIILHDFSGGYFDKSFNFSDVAKNLDMVAYNNYPVWGGQKEPIPAHQIACGLDLMRGLKRKNFWITEAIMGAQGHDVIGYLPRPNQAKMWSYEAMARGCSSLIYFRYRGAIKGAEQFCYGIIDQDNKKRRKFYEVQSFFSEIKKYEGLVESDIKSDVAIVYDYKSMASFRIQKQSFLMNYSNEIYRLYKPFYEKNINIDVIDSSNSFDGYKVLVLPVMIVYEKKIQERIKEFAKNGGTVVFSFRTAIKDCNNNLTLNESNPTYYNDLIGGYVEEVESLQEGQDVMLTGIKEFENHNGSGAVFRDMIKTTTAKTLFKYVDEYFGDLSAVTINEYKKGNVYYIGTGISENIANKLIDKIIIDSNLDYIDSPEGVEVVRREFEGKKYLFVMNHTGKNVIFKNKALSAYHSEIILEE